MDLIYFEPLNGGFHTGHCRIFLEGALRDVRVRSITILFSLACRRGSEAKSVSWLAHELAEM